MKNLYFFVTMCKTWQYNDPKRFLHHYFITNDAFITCFLIALGAAIVGAALFYGWIGNQSVRLSKVSTWLVILLAVGLVSLGLTHLSVIGSAESQTGFFEDLISYRTELLNKEEIPDEQFTQFETEVTQVREAMDKGCDVVYMLDLGNAILAIVFFFIISLCVKRFTTYAVAVPLDKP